MRVRILTVAAGMMLLNAAPALAAEADDALLQAIGRCGAVSSDAARLACYDGLIPRVHAAMAPAPAPAASPSAGPAASAQAAATPSKDEQKSWFGFDMGGLFGTNPATQTKPEQFGAEKTAAAQAAAEPGAAEVIDSITAKVTDYAINPMGKFIVTLDNGQIWRQLQADEGRARFEREPAANTVKIERGALGSYILSINGSNRVFKVTRIK